MSLWIWKSAMVWPMKRKIMMLLLGLGILLFILFPEVVNRGAKTGLLLWFHTVLPALLPFMILSTFMVKENITEVVSRVAAPIFCRLFGVSKPGCYPVVIGLLSGYPVGARTVAQVYEQGLISRKEAQYILSFCNNASPMFMMEYIGLECMNLKMPACMCVLLYLSAWLNAFCERIWKKYRFREEEKSREMNWKHRRGNWIASLDESILDAFVVITKVGGYMLLFSIIALWMENVLPVNDLIKYIGIGVLEITTGGALFARLSMEEWLRGGIFLGLCAFGGFSSVAQTASVLSDTDLSVKKYIFAKVRQMIIAFGLGVGWFHLFS